MFLQALAKIIASSTLMWDKIKWYEKLQLLFFFLPSGTKSSTQSPLQSWAGLRITKALLIQPAHTVHELMSATAQNQVRQTLWNADI